jgi:hypothetical protein
MKDIDCKVIKDLMPLYVNDTCSKESKDIVEKHLEGCESCRHEHKLLKRKIPIEQNAHGDSSVVVNISKKWKNSKKKSFLYGFIFLFVIVAAIVDFMIYSNITVPVSNNNITISNVSELENGKIFFTLEVTDSLYAKDYTWIVKDHVVYITINSVRYNIFHKKNIKYDFGKNTLAKNNWLFNVKNTGIKKIYYSTLDAPEKDKNAILIWSEDTELKQADDAVNTYVQTYDCYGNSEPGLLAEQLFEARNPYVGDMSANGRLAGLLNIQYVLGKYKNELQTKKEPYGWTLEFQEEVDESKEEKFNEAMTDYAYVLLALTNNLGEVSWKYSNHSEQKEMTVTAKEASEAMGENIKNFCESSISVQELLLKLGIE